MKKSSGLIEDLAQEMSGADLGDLRRTRRLAHMVGAIARQPDQSFPQIFSTPAQLEAAYRFFNNPEVGHEAILTPHVGATLQRAEQAGTVLVVHDTTEFDFGGQTPRAGLGRLRTSGQGFYAHWGLILRADGSRDPLGLIGLRTVFRSAQKGPRTATQRRQASDNESQRWASLAHESHQLLTGRAQGIHLMDREGDSYPLLADLTLAPMRFIVRLCHDRRVDPAAGPPPLPTLKQVVGRTPFAAQRQVPLSARGKRGRTAQQLQIHPPRQMRVATLCFAAQTVSLRRPRTYPAGSLPESLSVNVVHVWEVEPPPGEQPVDWWLATQEPIETEQDILQVVDWYRARWVIEEFNKALKTGCSYQSRQLETQHGLLNVLAVVAPIAWLLLRLRNLARNEPQAPAERVLQPVELEALKALAPKPLSERPTAQEALEAVAKLGGHLKHNGPPGWLVLFRGYKNLQVFAEGWEAALATVRKNM